MTRKRAMNTPSVEIGWLITSGDKWHTYEGQIFENAKTDESGYFIPKSDAETDDGELLYIETHPHQTDRVFVSLCKINEAWLAGFTSEPRDLGSLVRDYIKELDPNAKVRFGIIETQR